MPATARVLLGVLALVVLVFSGCVDQSADESAALPPSDPPTASTTP